MMARIIQEQINWEQKQFPGLKVLDVALHMDEQGAPHIHERRAWVYTDKAGNLAISQNKSLEQMGVELPNPNKPRSRFNNRKMTFSPDVSRTSSCRYAENTDWRLRKYRRKKARAEEH